MQSSLLIKIDQKKISNVRIMSVYYKYFPSNFIGIKRMSAQCRTGMQGFCVIQIVTYIKKMSIYNYNYFYEIYIFFHKRPGSFQRSLLISIFFKMASRKEKQNDAVQRYKINTKYIVLLLLRIVKKVSIITAVYLGFLFCRQ